MVAENQLSVIERRSLKQHEAVIERGMHTFLEVGGALKSILDDKLYRETHQTFAKYCSDKWGLEKTRAYQLIEACEVRQEVSTIVDESELPKNEAQYREVAKAPPDKRADVVAKANEKAWSEDRNPTAKDFREAAIEASRQADLEEETISLPVQMSPAELAVQNRVVGQAIVNSLNEATRKLKAVESIPGTEMLCSKSNSIARQIEVAKLSIVSTIPHSICPRCKGKPKNCGHCGNHGWVNNVMARELGLLKNEQHA